MLKESAITHAKANISKTTYNVFAFLFILSFLFAIGNFGVISIFKIITSLFGSVSEKLPELTLWIIFLFAVSIQKKIGISKNLKKVIIITILYVLVSAVAQFSFNLVFALRLIFYSLIGTYSVYYLRLGVIIIFVKVVFYFSIASILLFYLSQITASIETLIKTVGIPFPETGYSILIYNIDDTVSLRNLGFAYEPGPFGLINAMALAFELAYSKFKLHRRYLVYIVAIISSASATAGVVLLFIGIWVVLNKYKSSKAFILMIPLVVFIGYYFFTSSSFMQEKIINDFNKSMDKDKILDSGRNLEETTGTYRFASIWLSLPDVLDRPLFGYGHNPDVSFRAREKINLQGMGPVGFAARYGILLFFLIIYSTYNSGKYLSSVFDISFTFIFGLIIFAFIFSFGTVIQSSFFISLITFQLVHD